MTVLLVPLLALSVVLQAAAAVAVARTPHERRDRLPFALGTGLFSVMALHRVVALLEWLRHPTLTPLRITEIGLEMAISALALGGVWRMRNLWTEAGVKLADARESEARHRDTEDLWKDVFEFAPEGYLLIGLDGVVQRLNAAAAAITGIPREQMEGRSLLDLGLLDERNTRLAARGIAMLTDGAAPGPTEYRIRRPDGSGCDLEVTSQLIDRFGSPLLLTTVHDISLRRATERELRRSRRRLEEAQRAAGLVIFETDLTTGTIWISENPLAVPGQPDAGIHMPVTDAFDFIIPEDRERVILKVASCTEPGASGEISLEYRQRPRESDEIRTVRTTAHGEKNEHGDFVRVVGATLDITEIRAAEQEIRSLNAELEERVRSRTIELKRAVDELEAFSYSVSHDLRSPLRAMAGYSQMVVEKDGEHLSEESRDQLERIRASSVRMAGLIDGLLSLSRLTRRTRNDEPVDLSRIARGIAAELVQADPERNVEVVIPDGIVVVADSGMMSLVLQNLLANAWKFTRKTDAARIEFGSTGDGVFFVRDNGVGFDPAQSSKLFRPFQRLHRSDEFEGTGIGLATVGRIVRHYGGKVWADSAIGRGSTFWFTLSPDAGDEGEEGGDAGLAQAGTAA